MNLPNDTVDFARNALSEIVDLAEVGEFLTSYEVDATTVVQFASNHAGYIGWHWSVAFSGSPAGIDEMWMEPGDGALVAAPWTPWSERVQPGDLAPGDVLPTAPDDPRLVPGFTGADELVDLNEPLSPLGWSIGLGRERVLSRLGLDDAVDRWREGESGPRTATARYADLPCSSCGWLVTVGGSLGQAFGVCANAMSPSDGRLVAMDHGCGAHSETVVEVGVVPVTELVIDEFGYVAIDRNELPETAPEAPVADVTDVAEVVADADEAAEVIEESSPADELDASHDEAQSGPEENLQ
jgi:hypothetical protein